MCTEKHLSFQNLNVRLQQMGEEEKSTWPKKASHILRKDARDLRTYTESLHDTVRDA